MKRKLDIGKKRLIGLVAGIIAGVSYGTNPLFGKALMESGVPILVMLFFRYGIAAAILAVWMLLRKETFRAGRREIGPVLFILSGDREPEQSGQQDAFTEMSVFVELPENDYFWER